MDNKFIYVICAIAVLTMSACDGSATTDSSIEESALIRVFEGNEVLELEDEILEERLSDDIKEDDAYYLMVKSMGGLGSFYSYTETLSDFELEALYISYGVNSLDSPDNEIETRAVTPTYCPSYYPSYDRNKSHYLGDIKYGIDSLGRPGYALYSWDGRKSVTPTNARASCHSTVTNLGRSNDHAGHLIPASEGGPSIRANLIPQNGTLNSGIWNNVIEGKLRTCSKNPSHRGYYNVTPGYFGNSPRPSMLKVRMTIYTQSPGNPSYLILSRTKGIEINMVNDHPAAANNRGYYLAQYWSSYLSGVC